MRKLVVRAGGGRGAPLLLLLPACIENGVSSKHSDATFGPDSTDSETDSARETCPDTFPADGVVTVPGTCTFPIPDWSLVLKWEWDGGDHWQRMAHVGRFEDSDGDGLIGIHDAMGVMLHSREQIFDTSPLCVVSGDGVTLYDDYSLDGWGMYATVGDTDPSRPGVEFLLAGMSPDGGTYASAAAGPGGLMFLSPVAVDQDYGGSTVFLADLEADGEPELLESAAVTSAVDGTTLFVLVPSDSEGTRTVAADLDLDGFPEIITGADREPVIFEHDGQRGPTCPILDIDPSESGGMNFAVGNLDDDPEGEFAVNRPGILAICEADGTLNRGIASGSVNSTTIAIADLTGDGLPELIVDQYRLSDAIPVSIAAYDLKLNELWRHPLGASDARAPLTIADLDGDGVHEILVHRGGGGLVILDQDGNELASMDGTATGQHVDAPIVSDIDGDGLAEILISGEQPSLTVYTNDAGGWPVEGADYPWPAIDHFPGDRNFDGTLPDPGDVHWLIPGHNVWQGLAPGRAALPDIGVELTDACSDDCETTTINAYVSNSGAADAPMPITLELLRIDDGALLATVVIDDLASGHRRAVQLQVPSADVGSGVRAVATSPWAECQDAPNEAVITALPCR